MNSRLSTVPVLLLAWTLVLFPIASGQLIAQTEVNPGFNLFSPEQDIQVGQQSAAEVENQFPILRDSAIQDYVSDIGERLASAVPGPKFPYQFKVVDLADINAFALPGGFMYVNRGLIDAAHDEAELAGVMAHEMAHVALRHGTNQASKAYLAQAGLGVLGGLLGNSSTGQVIGAVGGFGLNSLFLKFSRTAEEQADIVGAQMLARTGYDPMAIARMFETLREKAGGDPSKIEQFFSSHPAPKNRAQRIQEEAALIGGVQERGPVGSFERIQAQLDRLPPAQSMQQLAQTGPRDTRQGGRPGQTADIRIEQPSSSMRTMEQKDQVFQIEYPENWRVYEGREGYGVTLAPEGGIVETQDGQPSIVVGAVVNHYVPFEGRYGDQRISLAEATEDLIQQITSTNPHLRVSRGSTREGALRGERALSTTLSGQSPVTGQEERVTMYTRDLPDGHIIYALFIAPGRYYDQMADTMNRMASSLRVNERAQHRHAE
jgi:beta-barrel assembly-enhancing protease